MIEERCWVEEACFLRDDCSFALAVDSEEDSHRIHRRHIVAVEEELVDILLRLDIHREVGGTVMEEELRSRHSFVCDD